MFWLFRTTACLTPVVKTTPIYPPPALEVCFILQCHTIPFFFGFALWLSMFLLNGSFSALHVVFSSPRMTFVLFVGLCCCPVDRYCIWVACLVDGQRMVLIANYVQWSVCPSNQLVVCRLLRSFRTFCIHWEWWSVNKNLIVRFENRCFADSFIVIVLICLPRVSRSLVYIFCHERRSLSKTVTQYVEKYIAR